jgi:hypothetical protein
MQYPDDEEIAPSTFLPLQGTAVKYKAMLDSFLSFVHNRQYTHQKMYTKGELRALSPQHVLQWMNLKAVGVIDPPNDANPTFARINSLAF